MKSLLLSIFLFVGIAVSAQNYRLIPSGVNCYINDTGYIRSIRLDSGIIAGTDSLYFNFCRIHADSSCAPSNCSIQGLETGYSVSKPSWIGKYYGVKSNGVQYFLDTLLNDTVAFQTQAQINDSWRLFTFPNNDYLEARIDSIISNSVLGTIDSVKYISLQTKDANAQPVAGAFNNKTLRLSKNHGLLTLMNFQNILNDTVIYYSTTIRPLTRRQVYNFDVGDIIQIREETMVYRNGVPVFTMVITSRRCISKSAINASSVQYRFEDTHCDLNTNLCTTEVNTLDKDSLDDTIFRGLPEEGMELPDLAEYNFTSQHSRYNGRSVISYNGPYLIWESQSVGKCHYSTCMYDVNATKYIYVEGLGDLDVDNSGIAGIFTKAFSYYKKGTEEWGTFFTGINEVIGNQFKATISPNPANNKVDFHFSTTFGSTISIQISDVAGKELLSQEFAAANKISVNTASLANGLYLYHIKVGENYATGKLVIAR